MNKKNNFIISFFILLITTFIFACSNVDLPKDENNDIISPPIKFISPEKAEKPIAKEAEKPIAAVAAPAKEAEKPIATVAAPAKEAEKPIAKSAAVAAPAKEAEKPIAKSATVATPAKEAEKPSISEEIISAKDIIKEFENNELSASVKYESQNIRIKGLITNITTTLFGEPYVELGTGELLSFGSVRCMLSNASEAVGLEIDSIIEISGTYENNMSTIIDINPCIIEQ